MTLTRVGTLALCALALATLVAACNDGAPRIRETTILRDTDDTIGPYEVYTVALDRSGIDHVELFWQLADAAEGGALSTSG